MNSMARPLRRGGATALLAGTAALAACGISTQQEVQARQPVRGGDQPAASIVEDATLHNYINQLGRRIAAQGDRRLDYRFYIVNAPR